MSNQKTIKLDGVFSQEFILAILKLAQKEVPININLGENLIFPDVVKQK